MTATADDTGVVARYSDRLDRYVQVGTASGRVVAVSFPRTEPADASGDNAAMDRLFAYLDGTREAFDDVTVALTVPTPQRAVLEAARKVPYGETADGVQLARMAAGLDPDDDDDRQTVQTALRENPVPVLVPDHRIEGVDGATPSAVADRLRTLETA
ncbi:MAG: methylated DNA-protein cysteine methyltransferase [halophilic archaeon J07HB67]|nr:MAG: methylated DNA-protein cysteine methyltransferase [halophilic archaeon J07HB67]